MGEPSKTLERRPETDWYQGQLWEAFNHLHLERFSEWGVSPIETVNTVSYALTMGIDPADLLYIVRHLDSVFYEWYAENKPKSD